MPERKVGHPGIDSLVYTNSRAGHQIDLAAMFKEHNPSLTKNFGYNSWSYEPENNRYWMKYYRANEARMAHGYPYTGFLQAGIFLGCALYTAKKQGLPNPHLFFKSHWFDWITCFKRFGVFGVGGGLLVGIILFGDMRISMKRIYNRYKSLTYEDPQYMFNFSPISFTNK